MREREIDNGVVQYVSPYQDDPVDRIGYRFVCGACEWESPIMSHAVGAERHADEHDCPAEALTTSDCTQSLPVSASGRLPVVGSDKG